MKTVKILTFILLAATTYGTLAIGAKLIKGGSGWYICSNCCKTKQADSAPWESGCKGSGGNHNYQFCGKAGNYNYTCSKCDASVELASGTTPNASKCCDTGGTHSWRHN